MIKIKDLIKELNKLPKDEMLTFRMVTNNNGDSVMMDLASVDGKYILEVKNHLVKDNPRVSFALMLHDLR